MNDTEISSAQEENLSNLWKGLLITAGITGGIFDRLSRDKPQSITSLCADTKYDPEKLTRLFLFMEQAGMVSISGGGYILTGEGCLFSHNTPGSILKGHIQHLPLYMKAVNRAEQMFKEGASLDRLKQEEISRNYHIRVNDHLAPALITILKENNLKATDTLIDIGCGKGNFLRNIASTIPDIRLWGMDSTIFVIQRGKKENKELGLSDRIKLLIGDITEDLGEIEYNAYDWCTSINLMHFIAREKRTYIVENMMRIARKGVLIGQVISGNNLLTLGEDVLMSLIWEDFTGYTKKEEYGKLTDWLKKKYSSHKFNEITLAGGSLQLIIILKT